METSSNKLWKFGYLLPLCYQFAFIDLSSLKIWRWEFSFSLQTAGNAVKRAADNLVTAAKNAAIFEEQETTVIINQRFVGGIAQELEAQEKILRIEKELAAARNKLSQIRQAKYRAEEED